MNEDIITFYWSRAPGKIVNKHTGQEVAVNNQNFNLFNFVKDLTVQEWYQALLESIVDVSNQYYKNNLKSADKIKVSKKVFTILECLSTFRLNLDPQSEKEQGVLNNQFSVVIDENCGSNVELYSEDKKIGQVIILDMGII